MAQCLLVLPFLWEAILLGRLQKLILSIVIFSFANRSFGQRIRNESLIRNIPADHYFRFSYENDFVYFLDYYYTSGMNLEVVKPSFKKNPLNTSFFGVPGSKMKYGLAIDHYAFTPTHITIEEILYGDRPYAGCISVNSFRIATDENRKRQVFTSLVFGVIGPPTGWKSIQYRLHKNLINAPQPMGWDNQIKTDIILSYKAGIEKSFISRKSFLLNGNVEALAGTINDKLSTGLELMVGKVDDLFALEKRSVSEKWQLYFFTHSFFSLIGYDATLQGGMFNRKSPYTISASEIKRVTFQNQVGVMSSRKKFHLELALDFLSKEFSTGRPHRWGSLGIAFELK
jgi:lipid A 3-O-deacylase